ncbi:hypothetical protein LBMAG44_17720 [Gemmatimonadota bacterium]|nr:hypothetical protein LBMAG44_17720 [Gemmatimonadota bacterium]
MHEHGQSWFLSDAVGDSAHTIVAGEVGREGLGVDAVLQRELVGDRAQSCGVARDKDQIVSAGGEPLREYPADASGRSGNQGDEAHGSGISRCRHGTTLRRGFCTISVCRHKGKRAKEFLVARRCRRLLPDTNFCA